MSAQTMVHNVDIGVSDVERRSPLRPERINNSTLALGVVLAVAVHLGTPSIIAGVRYLLQRLGITLEHAPEPEPRQIIEARLVRLGSIPNPRALPSREVAPPPPPPEANAVAVSAKLPEPPKEQPKETPKAKEEPKEQPKQADAKPAEAHEEDMLSKLAQRAEMFGRAETTREGDPNGIPEGTAKTAQAGDLYAGKLYAFFRRGWDVPSVLDAGTLASLATEMDIRLDKSGRIMSATLRKSSGNPMFDSSVEAHLGRLVAEGATVPEPPAEVAADYLGQVVTLRFRGKDAG